MFAVRRTAPALRSVQLVRQTAASHSLTVPPGHDHSPITPFDAGVPVKLVRALSVAEKKWDFWTTSDAFAQRRPESGFRTIPHGQAWIVEGGGTKVTSGSSTLLLPLVHKVKAIKNTHPVATGVVTPAVATKDGVTVNAYAVVYLKVTDFLKSANFIDPETNIADSERAAAKLVRRTLEAEVPNVTTSEASKLAEKIKSALAAKSDEYGLEVVDVEIRGLFPTSLTVPDKLRAMDPPQRAPDAPGHGLSADYWADVLTPPYFEKKKFGTRKDVRTPATVSLEWCIPSPPDYHHFNMLPKMTEAPPAPSIEGKGSKVPQPAH
ncbi:hypothetical protein BJ742DRAFT_867930 [Cladochytrium replicatum]|nr:hypothetical protein BJ742DRAFT_867930 [Cladochytrium replicatum]